MFSIQQSCNVSILLIDLILQGGGGLVQQIRKSYSLSDLTECDVREERGADEAGDVLGEPKVVRRVAKSGYNTRRSASESNSRSAMYFAEVDVDVRARTRTDEPDFSHIKSSEDISSGYSSADTSGSLSRAGSVGARVRARAPRSAVTTIKRPPAAEDNEVIIEELQDDDTIEYANMPPLVLPSHLFLSDTDPPFIYQYVGNQIKIVQVLGNYPQGTHSPHTIDTRDQDYNNNNKSKDRDSVQEVFENAEDDFDTDVIEVPSLPDSKDDNKPNELINNDNVTDTLQKKVEQEINIDTKEPIVLDSDKEMKQPKDEANTSKDTDNVSKDEEIGVTCRDTPTYDNDSAESDDEASFGTPDNSPRSKRKSKSPKGKYGKGKAPPPPTKIDKPESIPDTKTTDVLDSTIKNASHESLNDILNTLPNKPFKETGSHQGLVVNPIAEKKRRHKSKSPGRIPKGGNASGIGKLLQLPSKLAFWHKSDDKSKTDTASTSSRSPSHSRKSSINEQFVEDFQSCADFSAPFKNSSDPHTDIADDQLSFADAADFENEVISHDIMEKSDALQKLIDAKIESHPEYKFVSLHDEIPTASKSTDV